MEQPKRVNPRVSKRHVYGWLFAGSGFLVTVFVAYLGSRDEPPPVVVNLVLVILAGLCQVVAGSQFQGIGRADPGLARASVRRLLRMTQRVAVRRQEVESVFDTGGAAEMKKAMGPLSVDLSWLEEGLLEATNDWVEFHEDALRELVEVKQNVPRNLDGPTDTTEGEDNG